MKKIFTFNHISNGLSKEEIEKIQTFIQKLPQIVHMLPVEIQKNETVKTVT